MKVALIPCGPCEWSEEERLLGRVELPLGPNGTATCERWAEQLAPLALGRIFHAPDELARSTARVLSERLGVVAKPLDALTEVDLGLWSGLTETQLKTRFASAHRRLTEEPLTVQPPDGESLREAAERLRTCLSRRIKPNGKKAVGLVLRPFLFALARCTLEHSELSDTWAAVREAGEPAIVDYTGAAHGSPSA